MKELKDSEGKIYAPDWCVLPYAPDETPLIIFQSLQYSLESIRTLLLEGVSNDKVKFMLPEAYKTSLVWTINARSLQNFLALRTNKAALWEIQELAYEIYDTLPQEHKYLFEEFLYEDK